MDVDPAGRGSPAFGARTPITSQPWRAVPEHLRRDMARDVVVDMGWGRLVFGQTFTDHGGILDVLRAEEYRAA